MSNKIISNKTVSNKSKGDYGEELAAEFLKGQGYAIISSNFRIRNAEIDIIAQKAELIVFVEVKLRSAAVYGYPREAVTAAKQERIKRAARSYIYTNRLNGMDFRFDVVELLGNGTRYEIEHIENAFC